MPVEKNSQFTATGQSRGLAETQRDINMPNQFFFLIFVSFLFLNVNRISKLNGGLLIVFQS